MKDIVRVKLLIGTQVECNGKQMTIPEDVWILCHEDDLLE